MLELWNNQYLDGLQKSITNSDIVKFFENLVTLGSELGASDIHIEPYENYCRIRLRIDGILHEIAQYPKNIHENIIAKFKIESGQMRPDEKRLPQDARVSTVTSTHKELDLRANTLPTVWWEKLVMRIVDKSKKIPLLEDLGIEWSNIDILERNLTYPNGIIITTWPTWSGKTTTLYACLNKLNKNTVNILTYEDPVESRINGLNQSQIRWDIWFTFAQWLRWSLRQDPDIVLVWEIRDWETLDTAMEAAMTWHLVFSTVHTNSSAETITRVMNLWAKSYQICGTFNLVIAQRLSRKVCEHCQTLSDISGSDYFKYAKQSLTSMKWNTLEKEMKSRGITEAQRKSFSDGKIMIWKWTDEDGKTCSYCNGTWYKGRVGLFESMEYTDELKNLLLQGKTAFEVEKWMLENGMVNLERDGIFKTIKWQTTLEEVYRLSKHK